MAHDRDDDPAVQPHRLPGVRRRRASRTPHGATTTGPIFVGEDNSGNKDSLSHQGVAKANLYAEGTVTVGGSTLQNGAQKFDKNTNPNALCKLNNCAPVPFSNFSNTFSKVAGAATAPFNLGTTDSGNNPVDAWWIKFASNGTATIASCVQHFTTNGQGVKTYYPIYDNAPTCSSFAGPYTLPTNGAIYSAADVIVSGVVKGQITVATAGNVYYGGNLTQNTPGVDVIGEEATGSIYVPEWAPDASHNITIYSAQFSLNGAFESSPDWGGSATGTMNFFGSTAVYGVTPCSQTVGSDCTIIYFSGFFATRHYNYDPNLLFVRHRTGRRSATPSPSSSSARSRRGRRCLKRTTRPRGKDAQPACVW